MDWDYSFFISKANPFRRQKFESDQEESATLIVNEANRAIQCTTCGGRVGEVSGRFYEIEGKYYCFACGSKGKNQSKKNTEKRNLTKIATAK